MNVKSMFIAVLMLIAVSMTACGASPAAVTDLPAYPGATELKAGDSRIGDTLAKNGAMDAAARNAAGVGGKTEQRGFSLAKDATWDAVKKFYDEKLKAAGWGDLQGAGGALTSNILSQVNAQNDMFQTAMYSRGKQNLSVIRVADPITKDVMLILSLTTNP